MSFKNPQRIINKEFDSFINSNKNLTNSIATSMGEMHEQIAKQKKYTKELQQQDQNEGFALRSKLNELGTTGNQILDENIQAFWNEKVDDYFKIKNGMQDGLITKQEGNRDLARIMALVPQFKKQVSIIGLQAAAFKKDALAGNVSSVGSIENKSFLKRAGEGGNIGIVERGGSLYFYAPAEDGEPASMINGSEILTMENSGQNMYQNKPGADFTATGTEIFNKVIQPDSGDSDFVTYQPFVKGDTNPQTGKKFNNLEAGKVYTYRTVTPDKKEEAITALKSSNATTTLLSNDNLMKRVWQDEIPDGEFNEETQEWEPPNSIGAIATSLNLDPEMYKDGWHEFTKDMDEDQISELNANQNNIMTSYLAQQFYNDNASMDNTMKYVKEEVITADTKNESTGEPYYMDVVNNTLEFFENPLENKNLMINRDIYIDGSNQTITDIEIKGDEIILKKDDYELQMDSGKLDENGKPIKSSKRVTSDIAKYNLRDPRQQAALAQALQRSAGGNNQDNLQIIQGIARLYPELFNKRKVELSKTASKNNVPTSFAFKDNKAYQNWKDKHPLDEAGKTFLKTNPKLIAAQADIEAAGMDPITKSMAQKDFMEIEYEIYQEALIQGSLNKLDS